MPKIFSVLNRERDSWRANLCISMHCTFLFVIIWRKLLKDPTKHGTVYFSGVWNWYLYHTLLLSFSMLILDSIVEMCNLNFLRPQCKLYQIKIRYHFVSVRILGVASSFVDWSLWTIIKALYTLRRVSTLK